MKTIKALLLASLLVVLGQPIFAQPTDQSPYFVGLTNGKVIYCQSINLRDRSFGGDYLIIDGKDQVLLESVLYFQSPQGYFINEPIEGAARPTLMMREFDGNISLYSVTTVVYNGNNYYDPMWGASRPGPGNYREKTTYYFRKGNGVIQRYNFRNLKTALSDNPDSMALLQDVGRTRFIIYTLYAAGGAMTLYGLTDRNSTRLISPWLWGGLAALAIPNFLGAGTDAKLEQAVLLYNRTY